MTTKTSGNLVEATLAECNRCRELLKVYEGLGAVGMFGAAFIRQGIANAEAALGSGDAVALLRAYADLQGYE